VGVQVAVQSARIPVELLGSIAMFHDQVGDIRFDR
jgi:hypothetical protein